ncbi:helix-turn-helix domain-containing protein [Amycolatopsis sp. NPDC059021]|uniref:helix-turn-helix domain-containing protein n=1 Tax=Amycolatopsis sp. NPDC059021 TaxID=3346704 RepID=UPI00366B4868
MKTAQRVDDRPVDHGRALLPPSVVDALRAQAGTLARSIIGGIRRSVPEYTSLLEGPLGGVFTTAVETLLVRCLDAPSRPGAGQESAALFRDLGRAEFARGHSPKALRTACRVGGQIAWRCLSDHARHHGLSTETLSRCAEAISLHVRMLSSWAEEGHAAAEAATTTPRIRLLRLAVAEQPPGETDLAEAAAAAGWPLPERVVVVALQPPADTDSLPPSAFDGAVLADLASARPALLMAADRLDTGEIAAALPGWRIAVGPAAPLAQAAAAFRVARRALDLANRGLLPAQLLIDCADHLQTLILLADDALLGRLTEQRLAPLDGLSGRDRTAQLVTLREWLAARGNIAEAARRLGVHPQTLRHRVTKLSDQLTESLACAEARFELEIAVRVELLRLGTAS